MALAVVDFASAGGVLTATTTGKNTTGATLTIIGVSGYEGSGGFSAGVTISDSKGNTYTPLTQQTDNNIWVRLYYCANPTVGSGHTATVTGISFNIYSTISFVAFSGVTTTSPFDVQNGAISGASPTTIQTGSVTPANSGSLAVTLVSIANTSTIPTINSSYTIIDSLPYDGGTPYEGFAIAWNTISAASNPTWTVTDPTSAGAVIAVFKPDAGGGGGSTAPRMMTLLGAG